MNIADSQHSEEIDAIILNQTLTDRENNLIIESLLFSSSVNVGGYWQEEDITDIVEIAKKLRRENTKLKNIVFYESEEDRLKGYEDQWAGDIKKSFGDNISVLDLNQA
jgi:hypothetical protein